MQVEIEQSLERHRQRLEQSLEKLKKALRHWQISSAEYEALREELQTLPPDASREDMLEVGTGFGGTLVDEAEVKALLGDKLGLKRNLAQVIAAVGHRIDYVQENVNKVEKQIEQGENKLASLLVVSGPNLKNEEGLPIMDIHEELDEDGNVINATVNGADPKSPEPLNMAPLDQFQELLEKEEREEGIVEDTAAKLPARTPPSAKVPQTPRDIPPVSSRGDGDKPLIKEGLEGVKTISSKDEEGGGFVRVVDDPEAGKDFVREVPTDTPEEAEVRKQMLDYNLQEIGAVVAEINLEEDGIYYGHDGDSDEETDELDSEDEDRYGRAATRVITPEYQKEMEDLAQRIKERGEAARAAEARMRQEEREESQKPKPKKKGVRFAEVPDISPAPPPFPDLPAPTSAQNTEDAIPLLVDLLAMDALRKSGATVGGGVPVKERKPSIFKSERAKSGGEKAEVHGRVVPPSVVSPDVVERLPGDEILPVGASTLLPQEMACFRASKANSTTQDYAMGDDTSPPKSTTNSFVVERQPSQSVPVEAPDELNPSTHRAEVAVAYHRLKNRMIQRQGGFAESEEEMAKVPLDESGETRKISRFKQARLKGVE